MADVIAIMADVFATIAICFIVVDVITHLLLADVIAKHVMADVVAKYVMADVIAMWQMEWPLYVMG